MNKVKMALMCLRSAELIGLGILVLSFGFGGCKKNPLSRLTDPLQSGAVPNSIGHYIIYDDELRTGGGLGFIPGGENQSISLNSPMSYQGYYGVHYSWNGQDVTNFEETPPALQHRFAGFALTVTPDMTGLTSAIPKDLAEFGYTSLSFRIKGQVSQNTRVRIEGPTDGGGSIPNGADRLELVADTDLTSDWKQFSIPLIGYDLSEIRTFLTVTLQYDQPPRTSAAGGGGTIYLDEIRYE